MCETVSSTVLLIAKTPVHLLLQLVSIRNIYMYIEMRKDNDYTASLQAYSYIYVIHNSHFTVHKIVFNNIFT